MTTIQTKFEGKIELTTTDNITGEGTDDIRIDIESEYCSAWISLNDKEVKQLRDALNEWLDD